MLGALAQKYPVVRQTFAEAGAVLGRDLWQLVSEGPDSELNLTENTQPAMLAAGVAVWRVWREVNGPAPVIMAGHSLGEYTALVCAGALDFSDGIGLVQARAQFMQDAVPAGSGGMAAILGLDDDAVRSVCEQAAQGDVLEAVNFNAPGQVVVAGAADAVARAAEQAKAAGAKRAVVLPVSVPSHCALMRPAADRLAERLAAVNLRQPEVTVLHNASVTAAAEPDEIRTRLVEQLYSPVRWVESVTRMGAEAIGLLVECGPGKVLTGLNKRILRDTPTLPVFDPDTLDQALATAAG